jgi:hypothetical protein
MKLRDHPLMSNRGAPNWPPVWAHAKKDSTKTVTGEVGELIYVHSNCDQLARCYLIIDYKDETYVSTLVFDDRVFCKQLCELLSLHLNKPIQDIGDLEL